VKNDCYDHHAAIYFLLQDRLKASSSPRSSSLSPNRSQIQANCHSSKRRPSNIAERGIQQQIHVESFQSLRDSTNVEPQMVYPQSNLEKTYQASSGMLPTDYICLTCSGPILENTTSTTTCVRCARLRIRRLNFAHQTSDQDQLQATAVQQQLQLSMEAAKGVEDLERKIHGRHDSRDSGVSSGSSQDYGECTPTSEMTLMFPRFPAASDRPCVPMSQLVRKLSEVEGPVKGVPGNKMSVDEGVFTDLDDGSGVRNTKSEGATKKASSFDTASFTSTGSSKMVLNRETGLERAVR